MCEICDLQEAIAPEPCAESRPEAPAPGARTTLNEPVCPACGLFYDGTIAMDGQRVRCRSFRCRRRFVVHARRVVEYTTRLVADKVARDQGEPVRSPLP